MPEVSTEIPAKQYWEWVSRIFIGMKILSYHAVIWLMTECLSWILINPFTHKISLLILLTVCNTLLTIFVLEFSIEPDGNPMIDIFLCCQCLLSRYCIWYCNKRKNSNLVTCGSERIKYPVISILCHSKKQNSKLIYLTIFTYAEQNIY